MGSTRTIAFRPPSVIHGAPSGPTITPCGRDFSPSLIRWICPVAGSSRPSSPIRCAVYQTPPSGTGATSCGCDPAGTGYSCIRGTDSSAAATVEAMASASAASPWTRSLIKVACPLFSSLFSSSLMSHAISRLLRGRDLPPKDAVVIDLIGNDQHKSHDKPRGPDLQAVGVGGGVEDRETVCRLRRLD